MELYSYYRLEEKNSEAVSGIWKGLHIFLLVTASVFSIMSTVFCHILVAEFKMNCILYPELIVLLNETDFRITTTTTTTLPPFPNAYKLLELPIDDIKSKFSDMNTCYGSLYNPILSAIFGIIWTTFFLMCSKGGKSVSGLVRPWRIVVPSTIFTFIYSILCIVITQDLTNGLTEFEDRFQNTTGIHDPQYDGAVGKIESYVLMTMISSWIYASSWLIGFILLLLRLVFVADFQLVKVKIELIQEEKRIDTDPSTSYYTPSTSKDLLENQSVVIHANVEPGRTHDNEDPSAFEDFHPAKENEDRPSESTDEKNYGSIVSADRSSKKNEYQNPEWI